MGDSLSKGFDVLQPVRTVAAELQELGKTGAMLFAERKADQVELHQMREQLKAFESAEEGFFKVVIATNSAESSVTLADCDDVIDLGTHKALQARVGALEDELKRLKATPEPVGK